MKGIAVRIEKLIVESGLSSSAFAAKIGVSPSILSHVLNGRNKPSLDLILKIHSKLPEVDIEWLLTGSKSIAAEVSTKAESLENGGQVSALDNAKDRIVMLKADGTFREFYSK